MTDINSTPEVSDIFNLINMGLGMTRDQLESNPVIFVIGIVVFALCSVVKAFAKHPKSIDRMMEVFALLLVVIVTEEKAARVQALVKTYGRSKGKK